MTQRSVNPELHSLTEIEWQFFSTLTLRSAVMPAKVQAAMFFALLRTQASNFRVHFKALLWSVRQERGEQTGRPHLHALIAGLPASSRTTATCFSFMKIWEQQGGGHARVTIFNPTLPGVDYVLKGGEEVLKSLISRRAGDNYELNKFGSSCDVMVSESVIRFLANRKQSGQRGIGPRTHKTGGTHTAGDTGQTVVA